MPVSRLAATPGFSRKNYYLLVFALNSSHYAILELNEIGLLRSRRPSFGSGESGEDVRVLILVFST